MQVPFSTPSRESPSAVGPASLFCTQAEWCLCEDPGPHPVGKHGAGARNPEIPSLRRAMCLLGGQGQGHTSLGLPLPLGKVDDQSSHPTCLPLRVAGRVDKT